MRALLFLLTLSSLTPGSALADAISEPPSCPAHSEPVFCHGPATCAPRECLSSSDCTAGEHCAVVDLCVEEHSCGGFGGGDIETHVLGLCGAGDTCAEGRCSGQFVCVMGSSEDASVRPDSGRPTDASGADAGDGRTHAMYGCACQCAVGATPGRGPSPWLALALAASVSVWVKRRQRSRLSSQTTSAVSR